MPIIGPVPRLLLLLGGCVGGGVEESEVVEAVFVSVTVTAPVSVFVVDGGVTGAADVVGGGAAVVVAGAVVDEVVVGEVVV